MKNPNTPLSRRRAAGWIAGGAAAALTGSATAQRAVPADKVPVPMQGLKSFTPNTMMDAISPQAKTRFMQTAMATSPFSVRDAINFMVHKKPVQDGIKFDEAVESMKLRANRLNFKFVGVNPLWMDVQAISGKPTSRVEVFNFCDAMVARELLDYSLEFIAFLPCRIALVEDANKKLWVVMLDWDATWLDTSPNPNRMPEPLYKGARRIRDAMESIMDAAVKGDI